MTSSDANSSICSKTQPFEKQAIDRRQWLSATSAMLAAGVAGCSNSKSTDSDSSTTEPRTDIPLRVLLVGNETDALAIENAWDSVAATPLKITTISLDRSTLDGQSGAALDAVTKNDLVIYPLLLQGELAITDSIVPEPDESFQRYEDEMGKVSLALRSGACRYGGKYVGLSLGSRLPALLSTEEMEPVTTWAEYRSWVETLGGKSSEPLGKGWAAQSFLYRASSKISGGWLLDRESLTPLIDSEPYIKVLEQLVSTAKFYDDPNQTPAQIWNALKAGKLKGGIGFEPASDLMGQNTVETEFDVTVINLPNELDSRTVLLNELSPVVSISARCRQTSASKQLLAWLSGGEGSEGLSSQLTSITASRSSPDAGGQPSVYQQWLRERLHTPRTRTGLRILAGGEYYSALDHQVIQCLQGNSSPADALSETAKQWDAITDRVGREKQKSAWRLADGLGRA